MKKIISIVLAATLVFAMAACTKKEGAKESALTGAPAQILPSLLEKAGSSLSEENALPASFEYEVSAQSAQSDLGLSAADFEKYIEAATASKAFINTTAHLVTLAKLKDAGDAVTVKALVAKDFDSMQWICVFPEESSVVESGAYILLISSYSNWSEAILQAFGEMAVTYGEPNHFFTGFEDGLGDAEFFLG